MNNNFIKNNNKYELKTRFSYFIAILISLCCLHQQVSAQTCTTTNSGNILYGDPIVGSLVNAQLASGCTITNGIWIGSATGIPSGSGQYTVTFPNRTSLIEIDFNALNGGISGSVNLSEYLEIWIDGQFLNLSALSGVTITNNLAGCTGTGTASISTSSNLSYAGIAGVVIVNQNNANGTLRIDLGANNCSASSLTVKSVTAIGSPNGTFSRVRYCTTPSTNPSCVPCAAGISAPILSTTTINNSCGTTTVNLTSITASNTPSGATLTWHTSTPATNANKIIGTAVSAGTYYAAFYNSAGNCYSTTTTIVTAIVNTAPVATITASPNPICQNSTLSLSASAGATTYAWSGNGIVLANAAATTAVPTLTGTQPYSVTITNSSGCTASSTTSITVNSIPSALISATASTICSGNATTLNAPSALGTTVSGSAAPNSAIPNNSTIGISSSIPLSGISGNITDLSVTLNITHTYTRDLDIYLVGPSNCGTLELTTNNGLAGDNYTNTILLGTGTAPSIVTGIAPFTGTFSAEGAISTAPNLTGGAGGATYSLPANSLIGGNCPPNGTWTLYAFDDALLDLGTLDNWALSVTGSSSSSSSYTWNTGATSSSITVSPSTTTTYTVTTTNALGCTASDSQIVTVITPAALINPALAVICNGNSTTLTASGGGSYLWSTGATTATITVSPTTTTSYTVTVTNTGCTATASSVVTVTPRPVVSISGLNSICVGTNTTLSPSTGGSWTSSNTAVATVTNAGVVSGLTAGTATFTFTDATTGCTSLPTTVVTIKALPVVSITGLNSICVGATTTLSPTTGGTWVSSNTSVATVTNAGVVTGLSGGTTTFMFTNTTTSCTTTTAAIAINNRPVATITASPNPICQNSPLSLSAPAGATTYVWSGNGIILANAATTTAVPSTIGAQTYTVTITNSSSCTASGTTSVIVNAIPSALITPTASTICSGNITTLNAPAALGSTVSGSTAPNLAIPDNNLTGLSSSIALSGITGTSVANIRVTLNITHTFDNDLSVYLVGPSNCGTLELTTDNGGNGANYINTVLLGTGTNPSITTGTPPFTGTFSSEGTISSSPNLISAGGNIYTLPGSSITAGNCPPNGTWTLRIFDGAGADIGTLNNWSLAVTGLNIQSYAWDGTVVTIPSITVNPPTTTTYTVTTTNGLGCTASDSQIITVNTATALVSPASDTICNGTPTTLTVIGTGTYLWSTGATTAAITVSPTISTTYTVTVTNAGCTATASSTVTVNPRPTVSVVSSLGTNLTCSQMTTLTATTTAGIGATINSYLWSNGVTTSTNTVNTAGTYRVTVTNSFGCTATAQIAITTTTAISPNTAICQGASTTLSVTGTVASVVWSPSTGLSSTTATTVTAAPTITTTYTATITEPSTSTNLVVNPNFSSGNIGFSSSYLYNQGGSLGPVTNAGSYYIAGNASLAHTNFGSCSDHTSGTTGNMLIANGSTAGTAANIWSQTITVTPNTTYTLGAWFASPTTATPIANVQFYVNGVAVGSPMLLSSTACTWTQMTATWNSGPSTTAIFSIRDLEPSAAGNDLLLDDIRFNPPCIGTRSVTVSVNQNDASISGNTSICLGSSATLTATAATGSITNYAWSNGQSGASQSSITISPTSTTTYRVTITKTGGCTATASQTITVNTLSAISISPTTTTICSGTSTTLTATAIATNYATGSATPNLAIPDNNTTGVSSNIALNGISGNIADVSVTLNIPHNFTGDLDIYLVGPSNCGTLELATDNGSIVGGGYINTVLQSSGTAPNITTSNTPFTGTFSTEGSINTAPNLTDAAGGGVYTLPASSITGGNCPPNGTWTLYVFDDAGVDIGTLSNWTLSVSGSNSVSSYTWSNGSTTSATTVTPTTTTTYTVTVSNTGCTGTASRTVTVNPRPVVSITGSNSICIGATTTLSPTTGGTWTSSNTAIATVTNTGIITGITSGAATFTFTNTTTGCVSLPTAMVTVNANPNTSIIANPTTACLGSTLSLSVPSGANTYVWGGSGIAIANTPTTTAVPVLLGTQVYTVTITNSNGCTASGTRSVNINALPTPSIAISETSGTTNNDGILCAGSGVQLTASGGFTYNWSGTAVGTPSSNPQNLLPSSSGLYTVIASSINGCTASTSVNIIVNTPPNANITSNPTPICLGSTLNLSAPSGATTYQWSGSGITLTNAATTIATPISVGNQVYAVTVTNSNGCTASSTTSVPVNISPSVSIVTSPSTLCQGSTLNLSATSGATMYVWGGNGIVPANTAITTAIPATSGTQTYTVTITNGNGCTASGTRNVTVNPLPNTIITASPTTLCQGSTISLSAPLGATNYVWGGNGIVLSNTATTNALLSMSGIQAYTVTITGNNGCTASDTTNVIVNTLPNTAITASTTTICQGSMLSLSSPSGAANYTWAGNGIVLSNTATTTATPSVSGSQAYTVTITGNNGCTASATRLITVQSGIVLNLTGPTQICMGESATLISTANSPITTYTWSDGNGNSWNSLGSSPVFTPTSNTTYTLFASDTSSGCTANASHTINITNPNTAAYLATSSTNQTILSTSCEINGWTYYADPANPNRYLFAINWNPDGGILANAAQKAAAQVTIDVAQPLSSPLYAVTYVAGTTPNQGYYQSVNPASSEATFVMRRYWNVNVGGGILLEPVSIKFYFDPIEYDAIVNAANAWSSTYGGYIEGGRWFKTIGANDGLNNSFNPNTDISPIQVEPSGWVMPLTPSSISTDNSVTYVKFDNIMSFSGGTAAIGVGNGNPLPLELLYFTGRKDESTTVLDWATATENNCNYFDVERSKDAITFEAIGRVMANGTSMMQHNYQFIDQTPYSGNNYYRLHQVDYDGTSEYSNIININFSNWNPEFMVKTYPNPVEHNMTIEYRNAIGGSLYVDIYDIQGRLINSNSTNIILSNGNLTFDTSIWPAGIYTVRITNGSSSIVQKIIKLS